MDKIYEDLTKWMDEQIKMKIGTEISTLADILVEAIEWQHKNNSVSTQPTEETGNESDPHENRLFPL